MNVKQERTPNEQPDFSRDKDRAIAAGIGASVGGAAFATAAYTANASGEPEEEDIVVNAEHPDKPGHETNPEIPGETSSTPVFTEEVQPHAVGVNADGLLISVADENIEDIVIEQVELPDDENILCSDSQQIMDLANNPEHSPADDTIWHIPQAPLSMEASMDNGCCIDNGDSLMA